MTSPNLNLVVADIVSRLPAMAEDTPVNNEQLLLNLLGPVFENFKQQRNVAGVEARRELLVGIEASQKLLIRFMLRVHGEFHGCLTGDCPHTSNDACVESLLKEFKGGSHGV